MDNKYWVECDDIKDVPYSKLKINIYNNADISIGSFNVFKLDIRNESRFITSIANSHVVFYDGKYVYMIASTDVRFDIIAYDKCTVYINRDDIEYTFIIDMESYIHNSRCIESAYSNTYIGCKYINNRNDVSIVKYRLTTIDTTTCYEYKVYVGHEYYNVTLSFMTDDSIKSSCDTAVYIYKDNLYRYISIHDKSHKGIVYRATIKPDDIAFNTLKDRDSIYITLNTKLDVLSSRTYTINKTLILEKDKL